MKNTPTIVGTVLPVTFIQVVSSDYKAVANRRYHKLAPFVRQNPVDE
jgi:hypothetical protein